MPRTEAGKLFCGVVVLIAWVPIMGILNYPEPLSGAVIGIWLGLYVIP